jgi:hypothetical protein
MRIRRFVVDPDPNVHFDAYPDQDSIPCLSLGNGNAAICLQIGPEVKFFMLYKSLFQSPSALL